MNYTLHIGTGKYEEILKEIPQENWEKGE